MSREQLVAVFFFAAFLFLLHQLYLFVAPFLTPLVWAGILALVFYPLTAWLVRLCRGRRALAAFALVVAVTLVAILPSFWLGSLLVREATGAYQQLQTAVHDGEVQRLVEQVRASRLGALWTASVVPLLDRFSINLSDLLLRATNWVSNQIVGQATQLARNVFVSLANLIFMLVALFFFFRDGDALAARVRELVPMEAENKDAVFARFYATLTAVAQGMIVTAVAQGFLAGVGYRIVGLPFTVFLAFLTGLASFVPLVGPSLVWAPAAVYLMFTGKIFWGIFLVGWGIGVVSTVDNVVKVFVIGGRANLPTFPLLISILGGLQVYGFLGVFLGPVLLAMLLAFIDIYQEEYRARPLVRAPVTPPRDRAATP